MTCQIDEDSEVFAGENVILAGSVKGRNKVFIEGALQPSVIHLSLNGENNVVHIATMIVARQLLIACGNHVPAHNTSLRIGKHMSIERNGRFYLYTSGNTLAIGEDCMFSNDVTIRCGESPHLIFDDGTAEFLDRSDGVFIGDHVWFGERAYLMKSASVASNSVVGACSVVTKRFTEEAVAHGGNPAKVIRRNVRWIRNAGQLGKGTPFRQSFDSYHGQFPKPL